MVSVLREKCLKFLTFKIWAAATVIISLFPYNARGLTQEERPPCYCSYCCYNIFTNSCDYYCTTASKCQQAQEIAVCPYGDEYWGQSPSQTTCGVICECEWDCVSLVTGEVLGRLHVSGSITCCDLKSLAVSCEIGVMQNLSCWQRNF